MRIRAHGVRADLPEGWEGEIRAEREDELGAATMAGGRAYPVAHLSTFGLPGDRGDFGSGAVELMDAEDDFLALVEFGPEEAGSALFAQEGLPRRLDARAFSARKLQRTLRGHAGLQVFFTERSRAFCLYAVVGDREDVHLHARRMERVLAGLRIEEPS